MEIRNLRRLQRVSVRDLQRHEKAISRKTICETLSEGTKGQINRVLGELKSNFASMLRVHILCHIRYRRLLRIQN